MPLPKTKQHQTWSAGPLANLWSSGLLLIAMGDRSLATDYYPATEIHICCSTRHSDFAWFALTSDRNWKFKDPVLWWLSKAEALLKDLKILKLCVSKSSLQDLQLICHFCKWLHLIIVEFITRIHLVDFIFALNPVCTRTHPNKAE